MQKPRSALVLALPFVLLALAGLAACAMEAPDEVAFEAPAAPPAAGEAKRAADLSEGGAGERTVPAGDRKLVRTVDLSLSVLDPEKAAGEVERLTARLGGYVEALNLDRRDGLPMIQATIRVPGERLEEALTELRGLAVRVEHESQRVEDVTARYVDVEARLRTLRATEDELRALLAESRQANREVEDIMAVYRELTRVQSDRESMQAQLTALDRQVSYSTISLVLWPDASVLPVASEEWRPGETAKGSLRTLVAVLRGLGNFLIFAVIVLLPVGLLIGWPLWALGRWLRVKRKTKVERKGENGE